MNKAVVIGEKAVPYLLQTNVDTTNQDVEFLFDGKVDQPNALLIARLCLFQLFFMRGGQGMPKISATSDCCGDNA
ncbi:hypothetical protein [Candidatus Symbiobacter mobilis]|uniref:hypothetical protein n=1 Tax=Candidatus Symbiobacter mobilis TaxID=1436290 RepID=UPI001EE67DAD|nr:hypothetical protein [Candidatus Symbiobacter mobilis]